ncbi:hypothetical protein OJAV_G00068700 [Oryzias javanicus]|uniref:Uncharacterized protein n=1 Tax=Oryzias javanicus TaxID=123683 RepID=A0A3S2N0A4_ORYJA|nr:hypothetical protein OJAV_G00068700 [Oryzias javanicus]
MENRYTPAAPGDFKKSTRCSSNGHTRDTGQGETPIARKGEETRAGGVPSLPEPWEQTKRRSTQFLDP